jgi:lysophospholipase L1-like esterase
VLSILIGINDAAAVVEKRSTAQTVEEFESGYRQLLSACKVFNPDIMFVLCLPFVYPVGKRKDNWEEWKTATAQRVDVVKKIAKEFNAVLVDFAAIFDKAIEKAPAEYWIWDGIHPTVFGHELMAREWINQTSDRLEFLKKYSKGKN